MIKDLKSAMTTSISEVLETMFFMPLEFEEQISLEKLGLAVTPDLMTCRLDFKGKLNGFFLLTIPERLLITMAGDFMGEDRSSITREHSVGIIKEVANMVVGNMFAEMDSQSEFNLGIPEIVDDKGFLAAVLQKNPETYIVAESIDGMIVSIIELND
jgi:CheY-specific phosphatase CheX